MGTSRRSSQIHVDCEICDVVHDVAGAVVLARGKVEMAKSVFIWTCLHQEVIIIPLNKPEIILRATMVIDQLCRMYFLPLNVPLKDSVGAREAAKLGLGAFTVTWDFFLCYQCLKTCTWFKRWQRQDTCLGLLSELASWEMLRAWPSISSQKIVSFPCASTAHYVAAFLLAHVSACSKTPAGWKDVKLALSSKA